MERDARAQDKEGERKREVRRSRMVEEYNDEEYDAEFDAMMVTNKSLFRCPECGRSFKKPKHLQVHLASHERERDAQQSERAAAHRCERRQMAPRWLLRLLATIARRRLLESLPCVRE